MDQARQWCAHAAEWRWQACRTPLIRTLTRADDSHSVQKARRRNPLAKPRYCAYALQIRQEWAIHATAHN